MKECYRIRKKAEKVFRMKKSGELDIPEGEEGALTEKGFKEFMEKLNKAIDKKFEKKDIEPESLYLSQNRPFTLIDVK